MKRILDKIPTPPGALPAKAQTWLLLSLTAVIAITLISFPGKADRPPAAAPADPQLVDSGTPVGVGAVESAARRMQQEAARNAERRVRQQLGVAEPRGDGLPHPPSPAPPLDASNRAFGGSYPDDTSVEMQIEREERLRRYRSLRAPPLVQSARSDSARLPANPVGSPASEAATEPDSVPLLTESPHSALPVAATGATRERTASEPGTRLHALRAGDFLEAILTNRLSGDFSGPVDAMVSADVYDRTRQHMLVPGGTRAIGEASRVENWGQSRLAVSFRALVFPDGRAVTLGMSPGLNQMGETGLRDRIDRRYPSAIAAAGAVGALAGLSQAVSPQEMLVSRLGSARVSTGSGLSRAAERILDRYLNRLPKVTIREGHRIRIYLTEELTLPAYRPSAAPAPPPQFGLPGAGPAQGDNQ